MILNRKVYESNQPRSRTTTAIALKWRNPHSDTGYIRFLLSMNFPTHFMTKGVAAVNQLLHPSRLRKKLIPLCAHEKSTAPSKRTESSFSGLLILPYPPPPSPLKTIIRRDYRFSLTSTELLLALSKLPLTPTFPPQLPETLTALLLLPRRFRLASSKSPGCKPLARA